MSDATIFVTIAFTIVWMQRKKRWTYFFKALEGTAVLGSSGAANIGNSGGGGGGTTPSTTGSGTPTNNIVNPATGQVVNAPSSTTIIPQ